MVEISKDRVLHDEADVDLQYLQDELVKFKEKKKRELEE